MFTLKRLKCNNKRAAHRSALTRPLSQTGAAMNHWSEALSSPDISQPPAAEPSQKTNSRLIMRKTHRIWRLEAGGVCDWGMTIPWWMFIAVTQATPRRLDVSASVKIRFDWRFSVTAQLCLVSCVLTGTWKSEDKHTIKHSNTLSIFNHGAFALVHAANFLQNKINTGGSWWQDGKTNKPRCF